MVHGVDDLSVEEAEMLNGADGHLIVLISRHDRKLATASGKSFSIWSERQRVDQNE